MARVRVRGEELRNFILEHLDAHPEDVSKLAAKKFGVTRQAVNKHMQILVTAGCVVPSGNTRNRTYKLAPLVQWTQVYSLTPELGEDRVWSHDVQPQLGNLPDNVIDIWRYGFTEMFNNAIDHSDGTDISVRLSKTAVTVEIMIIDNGVGIFKKIQTALGLLDERQAILELSKGKLTTDPSRHSGEGIFFASRMFDSFGIMSGEVHYMHSFGEDEDWLFEREDTAGTAVYMRLHNHTARTVKKVFDQYSSGDDYGFNKTIVPVALAQYGNDKLISRSQAKRVLARVELFKTVLFDFADVPTIGQAFADEIFRVFANAHPGIELLPVHANSEVKRMISRARHATVITPATGEMHLSGIPPVVKRSDSDD